MKKVNKTLMAFVAILLSLVLISTSVVSSVFARFAVKKTTTTAMKLKAFGVGVTMTVDSTNLKSIGGATVGTEVKDGESASVTVSNLKLGPGDSIPNAVKFTFSGKPNVKMRVIIDFDISLTAANFLVTKGTGKLTADTYMFPVKLKYTLGQYDQPNTTLTYSGGVDEMIYPWTASTSATKFTSDAFEQKALNYLWGPLYDANNPTTTFNLSNETISSSDINYFLVKEFSPNSNFYFPVDGNSPAGELRFGFEWPFDWAEDTKHPNQIFDLDLTTGANYKDVSLDFDAIETYFAKKATTPSFSVSYTVKLEQIS